MIAAAIFFSNQTIVKDKIAFITAGSQHIPSDPKADVLQVDTKPPLSSLVLGQYNFLVEEKGSGYKVTTLRNQTDQKELNNFSKQDTCRKATGEMIKSTMTGGSERIF
ncbi:hypothetical protein QKW52_07515 [Bacillus sonorensis]|nr:hypothetical protein [Bacillus sonorensis]